MQLSSGHALYPACTSLIYNLKASETPNFVRDVRTVPAQYFLQQWQRTQAHQNFTQKFVPLHPQQPPTSAFNRQYLRYNLLDSPQLDNQISRPFLGNRPQAQLQHPSSPTTMNSAPFTSGLRSIHSSNT